MKLDQEIVKIIDAAEISGNTLKLTQQLDRPTYTRVNKALELIGLKRNRKQGCHVAEGDISELVDSIINTGEVADQKKIDQFYETPSAIVDMMLQEANIKHDDLVLEPSAGHGAILDGLVTQYPTTQFMFIEQSPERYKKVSDKYLGRITCLSSAIDNFLDYSNHANYSFSKILMNPPFTRQQDIDHVLHAMTLLAKIPDARIVAIMSESTFWRENKKTNYFWAAIRSSGMSMKIVELPAGSFKSSGTMVKTRMLILSR